MFSGPRLARFTMLGAPLGVALVLAWIAAPAMSSASPEPTPEPDERTGSLVVVLDASESMTEDAGDGQARIEVAKQGLLAAFDAVSAPASVGLRVYGASVEEGLRSCSDSDLLVPVEPVDKRALFAGVEGIQPLGDTPIGYALGEALGDLPGEGPRSILLVSDGEEDCGADPCQVAREIGDSDDDLHIDVVGLQVDEEAREQLTCIASAGGGTYFDVPDATTLPSTLTRLSVSAARGYERAGAGVEGGPAAASAEAISDGKWLDTIGDSSTEYYRLLDPERGTLHVAATMRPLGLGTADGAEVNITVTSVEGIECGPGARANPIGVATARTPVTASYSLSPEDREDCGDGPYTMAVSSPDRADVLPLEILVASEPGINSTENLPPAAKPGDFGVEGDEPESDVSRVVGAPSFSGAPTVAVGTHSDTIRGGEARFYRVDVDWGQQLVCDVTVGQNPGAEVGEPVGLNAQAYGFGRALINQPTENGDVTYDGSTPVELHVESLPVRYENRSSDFDAVTTSARAGGYYCAVFANASAEQIEGFGEAPVTLNVSVLGDAGAGAPSYLEEPESAQNAVDPVEEGGPATGLIMGVGAAIVAAAAGVWFYLRHRNPSEESASEESAAD